MKNEINENKALSQTSVSSSIYKKTFNGMYIGKKDSNGIELKNGDNIIIEVCKPDGANRNGVYHKGQIVYENCSFQLK